MRTVGPTPGLAQELGRDEVDDALAPTSCLNDEKARAPIDKRFDRLELAGTELAPRPKGRLEARSGAIRDVGHGRAGVSEVRLSTVTHVVYGDNDVARSVRPRPQQSRPDPPLLTRSARSAPLIRERQYLRRSTFPRALAGQVGRGQILSVAPTLRDASRAGYAQCSRPDPAAHLASADVHPRATLARPLSQGRRLLEALERLAATLPLVSIYLNRG